MARICLVYNDSLRYQNILLMLLFQLKGTFLILKQQIQMDLGYDEGENNEVFLLLQQLQPALFLPQFLQIIPFLFHFQLILVPILTQILFSYQQHLCYLIGQLLAIYSEPVEHLNPINLNHPLLSQFELVYYFDHHYLVN